MGYTNNKVEIPGDKVYDSLKEALDAYNVKKCTYGYRISHGWDRIKAITTAVDTIKGKEQTINVPGHGKFDSISKACEFFGTPYSLYASRTSKGMDKIRAITEPINHCRKERRLSEQVSKIKEQCKLNGITYKTFRKRLSSGMTETEALRPKNTIMTPEIAEALKQNNVTKGAFYSRLDRGMSIDGAVSSRPKIEIRSIYEWTQQSVVDTLNITKTSMTKIYARIKAQCFWDKHLYIISMTHTRLKYVGLNNKAYYKVSWSDKYVTAREIIEYANQELLPLYDLDNPTGEYRPYRS